MLLIGMWYLNKSSLVTEEFFYLGKSTNASESPILKAFGIFSFTDQPQLHSSYSSYAEVPHKVRGCHVLRKNLGVFLIRTIHWCAFFEIWTKALLSWRVAQNDNIYPICFNPFPHPLLHWVSSFIRASKSNISSWLGKQGIIFFFPDTSKASVEKHKTCL